MANRYDTNNAVGSADPRDLFDNSIVIDEFANSSSETAVDRLGTERKTLTGLQASVADAIADVGYTGTGVDGAIEDYAAGIEITQYNQVVRDVDGEFWKVTGATDLPYTTTGAGLPEGGVFVAVGDAVLRQELADGTADIGGQTAQSVADLRGDLADPAQGGGLVSVTTSTGEQSLDEALSERTVFVNTIDSLLGLDASLLTDNVQINVKEYATGSGAGGGIFYWDATSEETPNLGQIFQVTGVSVGRWKRKSPAKRPEDWGAFGDNTTDDTTAVKAWWESDEPVVVAERTYLISGTDEFFREVDQDDFYAVLGKSEFNVSVPRSYLFRVEVVTNRRRVWVDKGKIVGNDNVARPLVISTATEITAESVIVNGTVARGVFANSGLDYSSSAIGITVACESSQIFVTKAIVLGVNRDYVNPGLVASVGISITSVINSVTVWGNVVTDVQSPSGDADADGISVFSRDRLLVGRQNVAINIYGNRVNNCKGRFIKMQATGAEIHGNSLRSTTGEIITSFRAIDCQFGGCNVHDNFWNLYGGVTGGSEAVFCQAQIKDEGNWENRQVVRNNEIILERDLRYLFSGSLNGGGCFIGVSDNYVNQTVSTAMLQNLARLDTSDITAVDSCNIEVENNKYPSESDVILQLVGADFSGVSATADKLSVQLIGNRNLSTPTNLSNKWVSVAAADIVPYLRNLVARDNNTGGDERIDSKSLDVNNMHCGNSFYYGTNGSTGGILNAPTGYNRFVHLNTLGKEQVLSSNDNNKFAKRNAPSGSWYEYTGVAL